MDADDLVITLKKSLAKLSRTCLLYTSSVLGRVAELRSGGTGRF